MPKAKIKKRVVGKKKTTKKPAKKRAAASRVKKTEQESSSIIFDSKVGKTDALFVSDPEENQQPASPIQSSPLELNKVAVDLDNPLIDGEAEKFETDIEQAEAKKEAADSSLDNQPSPAVTVNPNNPVSQPQQPKKKPWWKFFSK